MTATNITNFRKNIFTFMEQTVKYNMPINITSKDGNAVLMSRTDYDSLMETLYLTSIPGMEEKITSGLNTPIEECLSEDEVEW